ncbi:hypothetical protein [Pseudomonas sp.]|uniref:hypothetical protein n=1 Tax=Pseudomonas sp. TaxID=306 RepID=UPI0028AB83FA|nr:hypothetical protein [Pseudomonas sp.]
MIVLADNDVLVALAQCDLVDEALTVLECSFADCYVLDEAPFSLYLNNPVKCLDKRLGNPAAFNRLCHMVESCQKLGAAEENIDLLEQLMLLDEVHDGELQLTLHAENLHSQNANFTLTTGDKNFLSAIYKSDCQLAKAILYQRVECLESQLVKAIGIYGHSHITSKVGYGKETTINSKKFDTVLNMAFGNGRSEQHALECLKNYMPARDFLRP